MKKILFLLVAVLCAVTGYAETNPRPFTIPSIHEWKGGVGQLALTADSRILYADARLRPAAGTAGELRGTALFRSRDAEFYLADPVTGRLGFVRDGYLFTFRHALKPGTHEHIAIEGDHRETRLYVNGRLVETLGPDVRLMPRNKPFKQVRTLQFPLQRTDATLRSRVTNLRVESPSPFYTHFSTPYGANANTP